MNPIRRNYALIGLFVGASVDLVINLLAGALQQRAFGDQFSSQSVLWLVGLAVAGLLIGYWLGGAVAVPASAAPAHAPTSPAADKPVEITRLKALLSYGKLRGQGIRLSDILLVGSRLDIDTRDEEN